MHSEADAVLVARERLADLLQSPDRLARISAIRSDVTARAASLTTQLRTTVQSHLDETRRAVNYISSYEEGEGGCFEGG